MMYLWVKVLYFGLMLRKINIMSITKVWIKEGCIACGSCEQICPEVFRVTDQSRVQEGVSFTDYEEKIKEAAESCPVEVIKYS
jgi:ferredoxin